MDLFDVLGRVVWTLFVPAACVFIVVLFSAFMTSWLHGEERAFDPEALPKQVLSFVGLMVIFSYLLFMVVFIPNIWWY